ncbi:MAG: hypothetical protein ACTHJQ_05495 [Rhizobiaceae bacterium]
MVRQSGNTYLCQVAHTSGAFATDFAAGKWDLFVPKGDQGIQGIQGNPGTPGVVQSVAAGGGIAVDSTDPANPIVKALARERLTANRTYYVATTGSDSNNGLTSGAAFLTIQKALNVIIGTLDLGGFNVTIQVAAGTYTGAISFASPQVGAGNITLAEDTTTPANCFINTTGVGTCIIVDGAGSRLFVQGFKFSGQPSALLAQNDGYIKTTLLNEFSTCTGHVIQATKGGIIEAVAPEIVSGSASGGHYMATMGGVIYCQTATWTISSGASRGAFAWAAVLGTIYAFANTFTGSLTGGRYSSSLNAVINTNGGGANYFPGSTAGTVDANGGRYA